MTCELIWNNLAPRAGYTMITYVVDERMANIKSISFQFFYPTYLT